MIQGRFGKNNVDLFLFSLNESMVQLILLALSLILIGFSYHVYGLKDKFSVISNLYKVKNEVKLETEKIKINKEMEGLADVVKFGAEYN
jgi:hypothetical protein